jgi:hypothetical protein
MLRITVLPEIEVILLLVGDWKKRLFTESSG